MLTMEKDVVEEWLSEFKTLPEASISTYAAGLRDKRSLVEALYTVIRDPQSEFSEPVCHQLFEFYRSGEVWLQRFTLQFLPELIWCYLAIAASRDLQSSGCVEALLLGIYNLPSGIGSMALTEGALSQHGLTRVVYSGPYLQRETFTAQNRFEVLTFLLLCYNAALNFMPRASLRSLCQMCSRICASGYPRLQMKKHKGASSRLPVSSEFMVQMIIGIYYATYNGEWDLAQKALDDVIYRAQMDLYPEPLLVANAIKASLPKGRVKSNKDGTRCIQVEVTPTASRISRNAVTSLSIRGHRWKRHDTADLTVQEELGEISEVDEGFCSQAVPNTSHPALINSSSSSKVPAGKSQRRSGGGKAGKEREAAGETCREHLARKQTQRAMSENLELVSMKRLTLTTSQSLPKPGSHSLARTATAVFSKSFEQVSGIFTSNSPASGGGTTSADTNRFSACSLQEEKLMYVKDRAEPAPCTQPQNQQRPPIISITLSTDM
ncbi:hyccin isoform X2 [Latimeria chalumnae]|uniref:hyccin isoform X2 n=1 Tax=Latimeria chalumnae TaxID=7897 RepID=UPI0003C18F73|nr:PREDICTED: hyccin isoform X2 [Latimeria chalumnae]|eukprot:XP_014344513.1 PREDICTED: hyccin isoform X2 [Latimeria chalumnae]